MAANWPVSTRATADSDRDPIRGTRAYCRRLFQSARPRTAIATSASHVRALHRAGASSTPCRRSFNPHDRDQRTRRRGEPIRTGDYAGFQLARPRTAIVTRAFSAAERVRTVVSTHATADSDRGSRQTFGGASVSIRATAASSRDLIHEYERQRLGLTFQHTRPRTAIATLPSLKVRACFGACFNPRDRGQRSRPSDRARARSAPRSFNPRDRDQRSRSVSSGLRSSGKLGFNPRDRGQRSRPHTLYRHARDHCSTAYRVSTRATAASVRDMVPADPCIAIRMFQPSRPRPTIATRPPSERNGAGGRVSTRATANRGQHRDRCSHGCPRASRQVSTPATAASDRDRNWKKRDWKAIKFQPARPQTAIATSCK